MDTILIVEDEQHIREFVSINLQRNDYKVYEAECGEQALTMLSANSVDLVLLDLKLPGISGFEVCKKVTENYPGTAVIMVTANNTDMDKIMGLELGADDYITKPFNPQELISRIRSVIRRTKRNDIKKDATLSFSNLTIDPQAHKVLKNGEEIKLTPKEFEIVYLLAKQPGLTYTRDQLLDLVWGNDYYGDTKTLDVHIRRLREKIEDDSTNPYYIETVWGIGYRWRSE